MRRRIRWILPFARRRRARRCRGDRLDVAREPPPPGAAHRATPIKHVVVIFQENVSFDHYFGTYPYAANTRRPDLLRGAGHAGGERLCRPRSLLGPAAQRTSRQPEVEYRSGSTATPRSTGTRPADLRPGPRLQRRAEGVRRRQDGPVRPECRHGRRHQRRRARPAIRDVMDYYDGNAVTGLWNYAQHFAMSDNSFGTTFGPSAPGAINLASGDTGERRHGPRGQRPARSRPPTSPTTTSRRTARAATRSRATRSRTGTTARPATPSR